MSFGIGIGISPVLGRSKAPASPDPAVLTTIAFAPTTATVPQNEARGFAPPALVGRDQFNNIISITDPITYSEIAPAFDIDAQGSIWGRWKPAGLAALSDTNPISSWVDSVAGKTLSASLTTRPLCSVEGGVKTASFDGVNDFMDVTAALSPPYTMYWVVKVNTWELNDRLFEALNGADKGTMLMQTATPQVGLFAASQGPKTTVAAGLRLGSWAIISSVFNAASSVLQVNNLTADTSGTIGSPAAATGLRIGAESTAGGANTSMKVKEILIRSVADDATARTNHKNRLAWEYGLTL